MGAIDFIGRGRVTFFDVLCFFFVNVAVDLATPFFFLVFFIQYSCTGWIRMAKRFTRAPSKLLGFSTGCKYNIIQYNGKAFTFCIAM